MNSLFSYSSGKEGRGGGGGGQEGRGEGESTSTQSRYGRGVDSAFRTRCVDEQFVVLLLPTAVVSVFYELLFMASAQSLEESATV